MAAAGASDRSNPAPTPSPPPCHRPREGGEREREREKEPGTVPQTRKTTLRDAQHSQEFTYFQGPRLTSAFDDAPFS